jgi:outer membrane protein assembly factor BamB
MLAAIPSASRHRFLCVCTLLLALVVHLPAASESIAATDADTPSRPGRDWPAFLGPTADGKSSETGIVTTWSAKDLPLLWHAEAGEGYAAPSLSSGRLFLFGRFGDTMRLTAMDPATGEEEWRKEYTTTYEDMYGYSNGPRAAPTVDGSRVYTFDAGGRLRCYQTGTGAVVWDVDTTATFGVIQNFFGAGSAPVIEGELLITAIGGSPDDSPGIQSGKVTSNGTGIVAFDKLTGKVRYKVSDELASYSTLTLATIGGRRWGFHLARGGLIGFEPASGKIDFHFPFRARKLESVNAANPVVVDDTVFITESYGPGSAVLRVKPGSHEVIRQDAPRQVQSMSTHFMTPVYHQGVLYGSSGQGSGEAELRAVDYLSGKVKWSKPGLGRATLLLVDGHLVVFTERGTLLLVKADPDQYSEVASYTPLLPTGVKAAETPAARSAGEARTDEETVGATPTPDDRHLLRYPAWSPPVLSHGILYLRGKGRLAAFQIIPAAGN